MLCTKFCASISVLLLQYKLKLTNWRELIKKKKVNLGLEVNIFHTVCSWMLYWCALDFLVNVLEINMHECDYSADFFFVFCQSCAGSCSSNVKSLSRNQKGKLNAQIQ